MKEHPDPEPLAAARKACPVSRVAFTPAPLVGRSKGFLGYVDFVIFECFKIRADLRHHPDGRPFVRYPSRLSRSGRRHEVAFPITKEVRDAIELQVIAHLRPVAP